MGPTPAQPATLGRVDAEQVAQAQLLYRDVNERIHSVGTEVFNLPPDEPLSVVCECLDFSCIERMQIPIHELQRARSSPTQFIVVPGHEVGEFEEVLERHARFFIVAKNASVIEQMEVVRANGHAPRSAGTSEVLQ